MSSWLTAAAAIAAVGGAVFGWSAGCKHEPPPGAGPSPSPAPPASVVARAGARTDAGLASSGVSAAAAVDPSKPYDGPLIGSLVTQAPVYSAMEAYKEKRIGYIRHGGKAPVDPTPIRSGNCEAGWFKLGGGGFVCGKFVTLDLNHPQVRLGTTPPNLDDVLPYRYAWNTANGTPLYKSVPSREDMLEYEPHLKAPKKKPEGETETAVATNDNPYPAPAPSADAGAKLWWQTDPDAGKPEIKLSDLTQDSDAIVAKRMVKGFYIAIDRQFGWNNRTWYKTTAALVAPADRLMLNKPPMTRGIELTGSETKQQTGFILSTRAVKYNVDPEKKQVSTIGPVPRFTGVRLTGRTAQVAGIVYRETGEGWWMKGIDGTYTDPGPPPEGLSPGEKWIDVNLSRQTLVAMEGDRPVYATVVSTGKKAKDPTDKLHDHQTVRGSFRIREKHISTTMDGDGPAPGDMPYSIEDVPYVMYFDGSYALHGAFWHNNFGREQSHGCVNLAPIDARHIFFWTEPTLPQGWHGVVSTKEKPGTRVVVHE
ncbi:MAG TPA: L,D-transpeptidase [Polyangiaceae bacterium]|nr:L,D-transpeptidase [Polyangiaceae bacterium]